MTGIPDNETFLEIYEREVERQNRISKRLELEVEADYHELLQRKSKTHRELEYGGNEE